MIRLTHWRQGPRPVRSLWVGRKANKASITSRFKDDVISSGILLSASLCRSHIMALIIMSAICHDWWFDWVWLVLLRFWQQAVIATKVSITQAWPLPDEHCIGRNDDQGPYNAVCAALTVFPFKVIPSIHSLYLWVNHKHLIPKRNPISIDKRLASFLLEKA